MIVPQITVLMPVRGSEPFIEKAIESILTQTFKDFEFLIIDDGADASTLAHISAAADRDPRIRVLINSEPGLPGALNFGINHARTRLIARMDADDRSLPTRLESQVRYLSRMPDVGIVGTQITIVNAEGTTIGRPTFPSSSRDVARSLRFHETVAHPSVVIRREILFALDGYRNFPLCQDLDLWLRAIDAGYLIANLKSVGLEYRLNQRTDPHSLAMRKRDQHSWAFYARLSSNYRMAGLACATSHPYVGMRANEARNFVLTDSTFPELGYWFNVRERGFGLEMSQQGSRARLPAGPAAAVRRRDYCSALYEQSLHFLAAGSMHKALVSLLRALRYNYRHFFWRAFFSLRQSIFYFTRARLSS